MQLLDMPCDVLEDILSHCSKPSRLALSLTSSKSNVLAAPYLLHNVHITCSPSHILSFVNYIIDHTQVHGGRGKNMDLSGAGVHIKILVIAYRAFFVDGERGAPSPTWASRLTQALALMPNLRAITLAYQVDEITASSSAFCGMLMSRPHLRSINLSSVDESAAEQLWEAMKTRHGQMNLQKVAVELKRQMEVTPIVGRGVGNILFYSRNSLTEVCLANCALVDFLCTENRSTSLVFPKVTSLSLTSCTAKATALAHSFPNVQVFTIFNSHLTDVTCPQTCSAAQRGYPTLFPQISSLEGDEPDVTRFLQSDGPYQGCRRVVIDSQWDYPGKYVGDAAPNFSVLDVVPSLRSFHFYLWDVSPTESWWQELVQSAPQLVFLKASVRIQTVSQLDLSCGQLPIILAPLALEYISLHFYRSDIPFESDDEPATGSLRTDEAVALAYATNVSTLEYFDIEGHQCTVNTRFWRVIREEPDADLTTSIRVRELDEEDGMNAQCWFDWKQSS